ncbi:MAG: SpoIIE family protein phosphatase [Bacteroidetes bacterium]|jgi:serine phosphatase RsbU (regulator of sigma subunit)|nr:SpoIIE family protein phosphatase [Bacteroidota bacterium]
MIKIFTSVAIHPNIVKRALWVALVVGIVLNLINQGNSVFAGDLSQLSTQKLVLTFMVPYLVSTFSSVLSRISLHPGEVANISARVGCSSCGHNEIDIIKGDWVPYCNHCKSGTKWKVIQLLNTDVVLHSKKEKSLSLFAQFNPNPVIRIDGHHNIQAFNDMVSFIFGKDFAKGRSIHEFLSGLSAQTIDDCISKGLVLKHQETVAEMELLFELRGIPEMNACQIYTANITELVKAEKKIRQQAENIESSIRYASRIQGALLPSPEKFNSLLPDNFILFKPKDIVSGDFFWITEENNKIILVAADCTGHGVPGALMSMLGVAFLNQIVTSGKELRADKILNKLRDKVIHALSETRSEPGVMDGMDLSLCIMDKSSYHISFAGAYNPLWIFRKGEHIELKGDKMSVGRDEREQVPFTQQEIQLEEGDVCYMFSDGYMDQIGGAKLKKLTRNRFREKLREIHHMPFAKQKKSLEQHLIEWKKDFFQVDDVMIIGFSPY